ncbi:hypothetical protein MSAN_02071500 [Mycena sanguinolenta]|uniref:Uncharacterized protein n=1 Tax=Mycena sanguinolenta TaxID=230812 RepID=A0A8H7CNG1_9AGAR|nr:hypothetical protein MSAN_02071500 [Mycena sanguinolenta]
MTVYRDLPALRRAWVQWDTEESQSSKFNSVDFLRMAISLVEIGVHCEYRFLPTLLPPHTQLTRYDFDAPLQTHRELLRALPNLQEVRIRRHFDDDDHWPELGEPVDVRSLRRLYVTDPIIFDYLRAPSLEEVAILSTGTDVAAGYGSLERFLTRSSCSPRRLVIEGLLHAQSTAAILQKYPSFTEIAVIEAVLDEDISTFLALFTISSSTPSELVFPHIREIGFACRKGDTILCPLFLDMLDSRASVKESALKTAVLLFMNSHVEPDPRSVARLEVLRGAALQVSLLFERDARERVDEWLHNFDWT